MKLHRRLGPWVIALVTTHVVAVTLGYARQVKTGALGEIGVLITTFPGMLLTVVGFGLLLLAGLTRTATRASRCATRPGGPSTCTHLAVALSFVHQL